MRAVNSHDYFEPRQYPDLRQLFSQQNSFGAVIETEPDALSILEYDPLTSSNNKIDLNWSLLDPSKNGGSPVLGYEIKF